ncbi:hypothetical protein INR49_006425 [Caranx melampygus]|nr:hypothetical protein INR49_006425 [Caranx melampygus]
MKRTGLVLLLLSGFVSLCRPLPEFISRQFPFVPILATWTAAQAHCRQHYTDLATIKDLASNAEVTDKVGEGTYWIGLHQVPWKWSGSGQEAVVSSDWYQSSDTGKCVSMFRTGSWSLEDCYSLRPFFCYSATVNRNILHLQPMNFYDAQSYCRYNYTDLSTIKSQEDNDEISGLLRSNTNINVSWIGLERYAWTWSDGSNSPFRHFMEEGQVGQDLCGTISSTTWGSYPCTWTSHFICHQGVYRCLQMFLYQVFIAPQSGLDALHSLCVLSGFVSLCRPLPEFISREFHVVRFPATWTTAQAHCRQHYTDLATIEDLTSNAEVRDKVGRGTYWIGLHQVPWKWSGSGQEAVVDSGWYQSSDTGKCVSISRTGSWSLEDCYSLRPFSCYSGEFLTQLRSGHLLIPEEKSHRTSVPQSALRSVKVRVRGGSADLSDPMVQQSILLQLQQKLKDQGLTREVKLWWNKQPDGEVFHREEEVRGHCEDGDACVTPVIDL